MECSDTVNIISTLQFDRIGQIICYLLIPIAIMLIFAFKSKPIPIGQLLIYSLIYNVLMICWKTAEKCISLTKMYSDLLPKEIYLSVLVGGIILIVIGFFVLGLLFMAVLSLFGVMKQPIPKEYKSEGEKVSAKIQKDGKTIYAEVADKKGTVKTYDLSYSYRNLKDTQEVEVIIKQDSEICYLA